ncbi:MAG: exodeoxyribonuclease VII small subunit [Dehalococcoidia bacterium]|nr:exodeoxyribonuclease VII small subunit [Dehalococcoidia bacterium]
MTPERRTAKQDPAVTEAQAQASLDLPDEGFEALFARLEAVSQQLEVGGLSLDQSLALYEEGMRLAQRCQALLGAVEQRIETLRTEAQRPNIPRDGASGE